MKITAQDILNHCKAVGNGEKPQPLPFWVEVTRNTGIFELLSSKNISFVTIWEGMPKDEVEIAARILGLDRPAPVVELEWVEDEPAIGGYRREIAKFNSVIHAEITYYSRTTVANIYVGLSGQPFNEERDSEGLNAGFDPRLWCKAEITKIITPKP